MYVESGSFNLGVRLTLIYLWVMGLKSIFIKPFAWKVARDIKTWSENAVNDQHAIRNSLISMACNTIFGRDHGFEAIEDYNQYKGQVPIRDYEELSPYIDRIIAGESDVLWLGKPKYFAKTSGTTSGVKYIPLSKESMPNHIRTASTAMLNYVSQSGNYNILNGKVIFLSGSPEMTEKGGIPTGRLSGIVNHEVPSWIRSNQLPSFETNCIDDWESKLERIIMETAGQDLRLISGIPPWVQMYYEGLLQFTGKKSIKEVFPNFSLFMYGGVNYEPYRSSLEELVGSPIDGVETYPASEGFIAFQDRQGDQGLLLNSNSGIFFEFIEVSKLPDENPERLSLEDVELDKEYALIINSNAGLWGYNIGDTIRFVSLDPFKIIVTGRIKHYISAFGEHVISKEVEAAILSIANQHNIQINEFTVAPQVSPPEGGLPYHEWFVEFGNLPENMGDFAIQVDSMMQRQNIYYEDLIKGKVLQPLIIRPLVKEAFRNYMKSKGKLGGQNKVPRLSNDRIIVDELKAYTL